MADEISLFPYVPRGEQIEIIQFIRDSIINRKSAVIESGTGTGKTICSLVGALEDQPYHGFKILYLTRTKSQQKQVMSEIRQINKKKHVFCVAIQGRSPTTCPMMGSDPELSSGTADELSKWCSEFKRKKGKDGHCKYFDNMEKVDVERFIYSMRQELPEPEAFQKKCLEMEICPYEMSKLALQFADVVCSPYSFLLTPAARRPFLEWMGVTLEELVVIVDEAHNVPDYLRDVITSEYTLYALDYAEKEARDWDNPIVLEDIRVTDVIDAMRWCFEEAIREYLIVEDGLIPPYFVEEGLMSRLGVTSISLGKICKAMTEIGEIVIERKKKERKLPRSYIRSFSNFIQFWMNCDEECYVKLINGGDKISLEAYCMDPYLAAEPFRECRSSIHMSGTLEPLEEYAQELGLEEPMIRTFNSPFDPNNLLTLYSNDVTTKHDELDDEMISDIEQEVVSFILATDRNTAVFFPSYVMMDRFISDGVIDRIGREVYCEKRGMTQIDLMDTVDTFRSSIGSVLFAVAGGRISEGLDFPDRDLEVALIIGIPYPYPTLKLRSLTQYAEMRFGNGWDHAVKSPTVRKMRQARGRLIRSETDRGVCVVLDKRIATIPGFGLDESDDIIMSIKTFFNE